MNRFIEIFEKNKSNLISDNSDYLKILRLEAIENFKKTGIPTTKNEEWLHTDIQKVIKPEYAFSLEPPKIEYNIDDFFKCDVPQLDTYMFVIINGWFPQQLKLINEYENGLIVGSIAEAQKKYPEIVEKYFSKYIDNANDGLSALNTALAKDGIFIYVPENLILEKPIQLVYIVYSTEDIIVQHRNLIVAEKNSQAKIVICDHSLHFNKSFTNAASEIFVGENAKVDYYKIQNSSNNTSQNTITQVQQERSSKFLSNVVTLHGGFIRNNLNVKQNAEGCQTNLYGLYLSDKEQHIDNHTYIEHAFPNCTSNEKYKGILDDKSEGVFRGKILVQPDAQKTTAYQANNNLLLSDSASVNSEPQLEIYADDVKCSHGATIGQLDQDALFYLRSRGISNEEARMMLMHTYASEIINKINIEPLKERMNDLVSKRLRGELSRCNHCFIKCC
ncbi:MAG: Fe-S cluster assembly protein SufD [Bacteroidales bacterium]|nr:Fe-S cluster assembly protein SufD [Bacteroidales bacterium]